MDDKELARQLKTPTGDTGREVGNMMNKSNALIYEQALGRFDLSGGEQVLEIGMGNGLHCADILALAPEIRYTGCDISEIMVDEATRINSRFIARGVAQFLCASAAHLPFDDCSFDRAISVNTMYFWDTPERELGEIRRTLRPGGQLLLGLRSRDSLEHHPFRAYGYQLYNSKELVDIAEASGFRLLQEFTAQEPAKEFNGHRVVVENLVLVFSR